MYWNFCVKEGLTAREEIVKSLDLLVKQWVRSCGLEKGLDYMVVEKARKFKIIHVIEMMFLILNSIQFSFLYIVAIVLEPGNGVNIWLL